jgi:hypothetical protein
MTTTTTTTIMPAIRPQVLAKKTVSSQRENLLPSTEWDADQLAEYVRERLSYAEFFGRKTALQLWLAGRGLLLVKTRLKGERRWTKWAKEHKITLTTAYNCMRIAETFPDEDSVHGLTTVEVKQIAGIAREERKPTPDIDPEPVVTDSEPRDGEVISIPDMGDSGSLPPTRDLDPEEPIDLGSALAEVLRVVESLSGSLDRIAPESVPTTIIASIIDHLGRVTRHAGSL